MAQTRARSPSADGKTAHTAKRSKLSHPNGTDHSVPANGEVPTKGKPKPAAVSNAEPTSAFAAGVLDDNTIARLRNAYGTNGPYKYALVEKLFQDDLLKGVKDECLAELSFTEKETDIYKVNQTGDLASLNYLSASQISLLPNLLALRDALYSIEFRSFLRSVTGCGPLSGTKQDMSVNSYRKGCHLLNHDDVIGTRLVSYILYMPLPNYQLWQKEWGGALELYPVNPETSEPEAIPKKSIPPSWNQFIFFEVQPGRSFHSVEEVVVGGGGEDGRDRLSISGWFHAAQEGEEGYERPLNGTQEVKSSRDQLASTSTTFMSYPDIATDDEPIVPNTLSPEHADFLAEYLNPVYLQPRTMTALAARFVDESSLELHAFLKSALAESLGPKLKALDVKDGLGPSREGRIPPHDSGIDLKTIVDQSKSTSVDEGVNTSTFITEARLEESGPDAESRSWTVKGPPHKWRYCTLSPRSAKPDAPALNVTPLSAHPDPSRIVRTLQDELFTSPAFRSWLAIVTSLLPLKYAIEARRFRPGLDYTLATSEEKEARLDVCLGLTPGAGVEGGGERWESGEWGGWECYMAPHDEEEDPAVYRAGSHKKTHANGVGENGANGHDEHEDTEMSDDEDDSTLLTVQPGFNRLLLVLRDEKVMRFVKYLSAAAEGSRWDICGEYEVGMVQEDEEEDEEPMQSP